MVPIRWLSLLGNGGKGDIMGKVIDKATGKTLAEFEKEEEGIVLKDKFRNKGYRVKMEW